MSFHFHFLLCRKLTRLTVLFHCIALQLTPRELALAQVDGHVEDRLQVISSGYLTAKVVIDAHVTLRASDWLAYKIKLSNSNIKKTFLQKFTLNIRNMLVLLCQVVLAKAHVDQLDCGPLWTIGRTDEEVFRLDVSTGKKDVK